jgi:hypothetical protein
VHIHLYTKELGAQALVRWGIPQMSVTWGGEGEIQQGPWIVHFNDNIITVTEPKRMECTNQVNNFACFLSLCLENQTDSKESWGNPPWVLDLSQEVSP